MLVWVDLETTGLDPGKEGILEIACIVTDDKLVEVGRYQQVTDIASMRNYSAMDPKVQDMHHANGLWMESARAGSKPDGHWTSCISHVAGAVAKLIEKCVWGVDSQTENIDWRVEENHKKKPQLAGSTVSFDRAFLDRHMPSITALLHYRNFDVTSINELARRFWPKIYEGRPSGTGAKHRAMPDIENSLAVARYYAETIGPIALEAL